MNRRNFFRNAGLAVLATTALGASTVALTGCNTTWVATAEKDLPTVILIMNSALAIVADATGNAALSPAAQVILDTTIKSVSAGLAVVGTLLNDYNAAPSAPVLAKITVALEDVSKNLSDVLAAIPVSIPDAIKLSISAGITLAITVVSSIQLLIPSSKVSLRMKANGAPAPKVVLLTPAQIQDQYNVVLHAHGYSKYTIKAA